MSDRHSQLLFESPLVRVFDVDCHASRSGCGGEEWCSEPQVVIPRRGVFALHRGATQIVADPNTALIFGMRESFRFSHPADGGDRCTVLAFSSEVVETSLGGVGTRHTTMQPGTQMRAHALTRSMATRMAGRLEAEESALFFLSALARDFRRAPPAPSRLVRETQRRRVEEVRALLAAQPAHTWDLSAVARTVHCSPYHLARQFRAVAGETIGRYLLRLRLALALDRLAHGETSLTRMALDLGFAHHSHFSARFKSVFGQTPSALRHSLTRGATQELSNNLIAPPDCRQ